MTCAALVALAAASCGVDGDPAPDASTGAVVVVATAYPLFEVASMVGGDRASVTNLVAAGAEPHDLELTPDQAERLEDADLAITVGRGFQPAVEKAAGRRSGRTLQLLPALADHGDDERGGSSGDPHVWLDPGAMPRVVEQVRDALIAVDRAGETAYQANAEALITELEALDQRFTTGLADCDRRLIVTSHAAFGHLADAYDLDQEAVSGLSPEAEPKPARLDELATLVETKGITTVFTEELVSPKVAETLARETGIKTAVLSPLEGLTSDEAEAGDGYLTVMGRNLVALRDALGCR
ncbi:MAG TPA: zinc ABC transporter substrate-binding protein [Acidimicrobiales bacterium]|nr:zinc ABC transporter substrate-binding protein [Acidimicrobiales bacterium]